MKAQSPSLRNSSSLAKVAFDLTCLLMVEITLWAEAPDSKHI